MKKRIRTILAPGIRLQITLWYTAVFILLLVLVGVVSYLNVNSTLDANLDTSLALRARQIALGVSNDDGQFTIADVSGELPGLGTASNTATPATSDIGSANGQSSDDSNDDSHQTTPAVATNVDAATLIRIFNSGGQLVYSSLAARILPLSATLPQQAHSGVPWYTTVSLAAGKTVRLYNLPVLRGGTVYGVVQVGASMASIDTTLHSVAFGWLLLAPIVLLLGALGSYWLASRAFTPVSRLTRIARQVEAGDLRKRVPVPRARDELRELALTLNDMIARLDSAFARQRRFVADASHELRTPVSAIRSLTDVALLQEKTPAEYRDILSDINAEAERLGRLIGDLLALARADEGYTPLERVPLRLDSIAHDVAAVSAILARERGIELQVETSGPVVVLADQDRLLQAILNLLNNALANTPANSGGNITVHVSRDETDAVLSVSDTGIGVAPEHLPHIFERFYRADPARVYAPGSSGLGLAIVDWVVRAHNGSVTVESIVGSGSTFTIRLPLATPATIRSGKNGAI